MAHESLNPGVVSSRPTLSGEIKRCGISLTQIHVVLLIERRIYKTEVDMLYNSRVWKCYLPQKPKRPNEMVEKRPLR